MPARRHHQFGFPWCEEGLFRVASEELRGLRVEVCEGGSEVALVLSTITKHHEGSYWRADERFEVRLRLAHPVWCRVNGSPATWDMERAGTSLIPLEEGPFSAALEWALHKLDPADEAPWRAALLRSANEVTDRARAMCEPRALSLASRFHGDVRLFVYDAITKDSSPRTEQMVSVCPGLLVLASERRAGDTLEGIRRGQRLPSLIRAVLPRFADEQAAIVLARRAPLDVSPACLRAVMNVDGLDINDMPRDSQARKVWYAAVADSRALQHRLPSRIDRERFSSFVSKYATDLTAIADERYLHTKILLREIVDWIVHANGTVPSRTSALHRVLEKVAAWHVGLWTGLAVAPGTPLPPAPMPRANIEEVRLRPMRTVDDLFKEGEVMRHCVAGYVHAAVDGSVFIYRGKIRHQRVTIAVAGVGDRWHLVDAAGIANQPIAHPEVLQRWVDALAMRTS